MQTQKNISVVKPGSGGENGAREVTDVTIQPGHTGSSVIESLGFNTEEHKYVLTKVGGKAINMNADLFPQVENNEKLFATTESVVGQYAS